MIPVSSEYSLRAYPIFSKEKEPFLSYGRQCKSFLQVAEMDYTANELRNKIPKPQPSLLCTFFCQVTHENLMGSVEQHCKHPFPALPSPLHERPSIDQKLQSSLRIAWLHKYGAIFKANAHQEGSSEWHCRETSASTELLHRRMLPLSLTTSPHPW